MKTMKTKIKKHKIKYLGTIILNNIQVNKNKEYIIPYTYILLEN